MDIQKILTEAKDLSVYKKLLNVLADYSDRLPTTDIDRWFELAVSNGKKILPKDKTALAILSYVLSDKNGLASSVQQITSSTFCDLPSNIKPRAKVKNRIVTCFWNSGGKISDRVRSLINFEGKESGFWCDADGNKCTIIDNKEVTNV